MGESRSGSGRRSSLLGSEYPRNSVVVVASGDGPGIVRALLSKRAPKRGGGGTRLEPHDIALTAVESVLDFCLVEAETSPVVTLVRALALQPLPSFCQSFWGAEAVVRFARLQESV